MIISAELRAESALGERPEDWRTAPLVAAVQLHGISYAGARPALNRLAVAISFALDGREVRWNYDGIEQGHYQRWHSGEGLSGGSIHG